jgi:YHS domain-containing protein
LKNVGEPIEVYSISDHSSAPATQFLDPVCRMYVDADAAPARLPWDERAWYFCSFDCAQAFSADPNRYSRN